MVAPSKDGGLHDGDPCRHVLDGDPETLDSSSCAQEHRRRLYPAKCSCQQGQTCHKPRERGPECFKTVSPSKPVSLEVDFLGHFAPGMEIQVTELCMEYMQRCPGKWYFTF